MYHHHAGGPCKLLVIKYKRFSTPYIKLVPLNVLPRKVTVLTKVISHQVNMALKMITFQLCFIVRTTEINLIEVGELYLYQLLLYLKPNIIKTEFVAEYT